MRVTRALRTVALVGFLCTTAMCASPAPPAASTKPQPVAADLEQFANLEQLKEEVHTRAVVRIERPEGVCYWQIMGADSLARMPVKDAGYGMLLLSAQIVGDKVQISVAGENQPLETTLLGRYSLGFQGPDVEASEKGLAADSLRFGGREAWRFSMASRGDFFARRNKGGVVGCCSCNPYKLTCCPSTGACMGCGTCGDCCD